MPCAPAPAVELTPRFVDQVLLLPQADGPDWPAAPWLDLDGVRLQRKQEFHVTLLGRTLAPQLRARLGDAAIRTLAQEFDWSPRRSGYGSVLRKRKIEDGRVLDCTSLIERIELPAFAAFRSALAAASGLPVPTTMAHVTLYVAGDPRGIGLPDMDTLAATRLFDLPLPFAPGQPPPVLTTALRTAYRRADYRITAPGAKVRIGANCPAIDALLTTMQARRAIILTACNPCSQALPAAANGLRLQLLRHELAVAGIPCLDSEARDPNGHWPIEPGLLAIGTTPTFDDTLLARHAQHALVALEAGQPARLVLHPAHRQDASVTSGPAAAPDRA